MKDKIINGVKFFLLTFMMIMGFYFTYSLIWYSIDLQLTQLVLVIITVVSMISEALYIKWVSE